MQAFRCVELFAGAGNITRMMRYANKACASADINYGKCILYKDECPMDICTAPGFALHSSIWNASAGIFNLNDNVIFPKQPLLMPRLCIWMVLMGAEDDFLLVMALVCRSFCGINRGTHKRDALTPYGNCALDYVAQGSLMLERYLIGIYRTSCG